MVEELGAKLAAYDNQEPAFKNDDTALQEVIAKVKGLK